MDDDENENESIIDGSILEDEGEGDGNYNYATATPTPRRSTLLRSRTSDIGLPNAVNGVSGMGLLSSPRKRESLSKLPTMTLGRRQSQTGFGVANAGGNANDGAMRPPSRSVNKRMSLSSVSSAASAGASASAGGRRESRGGYDINETF
jgi:hypothetical protein